MTLPPLPTGAYRALPAPAVPRLAELGFAHWREAADAMADDAAANDMRALAAGDAGKQLLAAIFGNSPFLSQICVAEPGVILSLATDGPDRTFAEIMHGLNQELELVPGPARVDATLARGRVGASRLMVAIADLAQWWPLERVTGALSAFAEAALEAGLRHLLGNAAGTGVIHLPHPDLPDRDCGFFVLALGKLGARELNYSSDVDLICLYDGERVDYRGRHSASQFYSRLAQDLVRVLADRTGDGYVFRVDLRLRPDPGSTPAAMSTQAALTYYESAGQNWERAALIKARPVAGDRAAGRVFLNELGPYLWRRNLDFAAIQDIHSIKRQIDAHRGGGKIGVAGHNVKLGRGGIREIEFFAQTQQLIWGGRIPEVRASATVAALAALAQAGRIAPETARGDDRGLSFPARHRTSAANDRRRANPFLADGRRRAAPDRGVRRLSRYAKPLPPRCCASSASSSAITRISSRKSPSLSSQGNLVFTGHEDDPETLATLTRMGFADAPAVAAMVRSWHHGRYRAMRSQRARELLTELVPVLLATFGRAPAPDAALRRFDHFLASLPAGVQLLSLFYRNPERIELIAEIMSVSVAHGKSTYPISDAGRGAASADETAPTSDRAARCSLTLTARSANRATRRNCTNGRGAGSATASSASAWRCCAGGSTAKARAGRSLLPPRPRSPGLLPRIATYFARSARHGAGRRASRCWVSASSAAAKCRRRPISI